jgi:hypothetical protein
MAIICARDEVKGWSDPAMDESKEAAKAAKKAAKAEAKARKKLGKEMDASPQSATAVPPPPPPSVDEGKTPAERAAEAAERQVRLQTYRVWIAVVVGLIGLGTLFITLISMY